LLSLLKRTDSRRSADISYTYFTYIAASQHTHNTYYVTGNATHRIFSTSW